MGYYLLSLPFRGGVAGYHLLSLPPLGEAVVGYQLLSLPLGEAVAGYHSRYDNRVSRDNCPSGRGRDS